MTDVHLFDTRRSEATVWDTDKNIVWGPRPQPEPVQDPYPVTADPMVQRLRPRAESLAGTYVVDPSTPGRHSTIASAFSAITGARAAKQIAGAGPGPQDFALVLIAPGEYRERIRPPDWTAIVSTTGNPDDVRIWADFEDGIKNPVLTPTGACYVEGIHFDGIASYAGDPGAGEAPATIWMVNGQPGASVTLVNIRSTSNNPWLNTGAWQAGDLGSLMAYKSTFEMLDGSQPVNAQTAQAWRSMNPDHRADYIHVDCEAAASEGLVVGMADLGYGARDRFVWTGGTLHHNPDNAAQFFHSSFFQQQNPGNPYNCISYCSPQVTYAGEGEHYWAEPADLEDSIPVGGVAPGSVAYYFPQGLQTVGTLSTGVADTTMSLVPDRWYFVPLDVPEARTLAGYEVEVISGSGTLRAGLWDGQLRGSEFFLEDVQLRPSRWLSQSAPVPVVPGLVQIGRGTYRNTRIYPGPQTWVGIKADAECVVRASATLAAAGLAGYQDLASFPADPELTMVEAGPVPAPVVKTGVV